MCTCMHMHTHTNTDIQTYLYLHLYLYIYIYIHTHTYIYIYIIHLHVHESNSSWWHHLESKIMWLVAAPSRLHFGLVGTSLFMISKLENFSESYRSSGHWISWMILNIGKKWQDHIWIHEYMNIWKTYTNTYVYGEIWWFVSLSCWTLRFRAFGCLSTMQRGHLESFKESFGYGIGYAMICTYGGFLK